MKYYMAATGEPGTPGVWVANDALELVAPARMDGDDLELPGDHLVQIVSDGTAREFPAQPEPLTVQEMPS